MIRIILTSNAVLASYALAEAQQTRFYAPDGRSLGTAVPYGDNGRRYYDERGRSVGTSTTTSGGMTTYYDERGRLSAAPGRRKNGTETSN